MDRDNGETLQSGNTSRYIQNPLASQAPSCRSTLAAWAPAMWVSGELHARGAVGAWLSVSLFSTEGLQRKEPAHQNVLPKWRWLRAS